MDPLLETMAALPAVAALRKRLDNDDATGKIIRSDKVMGLLTKASDIQNPTPEQQAAGDALLKKFHDKPELVDNLQKNLTAHPEMADKIVGLAKSNPKALQENLDKLLNANPQGNDFVATLNAIPAQPAAATPPKQDTTPPATPPKQGQPPAATPPKQDTTPPATPPTPPQSSTPPAKKPEEEAADLMGVIAGRPGFGEFLQNLQNNHSELADALGLGKNGGGTTDKTKLAALLPTLKIIAADSDPSKNPTYFKDLGGLLDQAKNDPDMRQSYNHIVQTAREHPEQLGAEVKSAQSQFNMMSGINQLGNSIGNALGMPNLGSMLGGLVKWLVSLPLIGPMIASALGGLMGSGQDGSLQGASNSKFSLAHEIVRGTVTDADSKRTYTLQGKLDSDEKKELDGLLDKGSEGHNYSYDKDTDTTTITTSTKFELPKAPGA